MIEQDILQPVPDLLGIQTLIARCSRTRPPFVKRGLQHSVQQQRNSHDTRDAIRTVAHFPLISGYVAGVHRAPRRSLTDDCLA